MTKLNTQSFPTMHDKFKLTKWRVWRRMDTATFKHSPDVKRWTIAWNRLDAAHAFYYFNQWRTHD